MSDAEQKEIANVGTFELTLGRMVGLGNINKDMTSIQTAKAHKDLDLVLKRWAAKHTVKIKCKCWHHCVAHRPNIITGAHKKAAPYRNGCLSCLVVVGLLV